MTHPKHFMDNRPVLTNPNYVPDKEYAKQRRTRMQTLSMITCRMRQSRLEEYMRRCYLASMM